MRRLNAKFLEETAFLFQVPRVPVKAVTNWQETTTKRLYRAANFNRQKAGLPRKPYRMLNSKGKIERVE